MINEMGKQAVELLIDLINTPSLSGEEDKTASIIERFLERNAVSCKRKDNNIWSLNQNFDPSKPSILLNSHHDTVKPNKGYTRDPFKASIEDGKLFGLGSNDAGGCLVALISTFIHFYQKKDLKYNLVLLASAEEENSGKNGIRSMIPLMPVIDFAIVGEPTLLDLAIAEKGLLVLDCYAHGEAGHAAHMRGDHAINKAMRAINWFETYTFPKVSETLKDTKMTVTQINAGSQHNVVPATCHFVVDIRVNDHYSNKEVLNIVKDHVSVEVKERSLNLNSSSIPGDHEIVQAGIKLGRKIYGSPTLSDQANLNCPSLKLGPGDSLRSHKADEFIFEKEIYEGIDLYIKLLEQIL
ncbi:M20 family metallo-hydrolase [Lutimonas zeaxanthinifaciens]|uniref:M20 family metallo-hydrolase n=1 Tax=Lutimonas zeaxanthinifaciens TaxID=3060215 RepID=UPI00265D44C7|nr:M20 family metallo-hydrolase [Lutimonas sp. YSD2104]WKK65515.1 M20 family metallo-hydrolase [Lutimonas sp. YSD2104]